ncbi:segregation/condensation protein A [Streptomyces sp. OZ13]|uniref:segregation and condensation protein A n=1 Tax=Streptomyces sp. OZ13 TaxID=3452210 RepID=UPI003F8AAFEC
MAEWTADSGAPSLPDAEGESPEREARAPHDGGDRPEGAPVASAEAVDSPSPSFSETGGEPPEPGRRALRDDEEAGKSPAGPDGDGPAGVERPEAALGAPAGGVDSPPPLLPETGADPREPEAVDFPTPSLPDAEGEPPEPEASAPHGGDAGGDRSGGPEAARGAPTAAGGAGRAGAGSEEQHGASDAVGGGDGRFTVRLVNFEGPFDLLLQLISKHKLDVTEVALSKVTDEFMAYIRAMGPDWDLDQTTEFLVVAATLLDLKAARLLPAAEVEDEADLALLEARDLLFARLLQYRAYKQIADIFDRRLDEEARRYPRTVGLEAHLAELLPEVVISIGAEGFAKLAVKAMQPKAKPQVYVDHIHAPLVSVREQAEVVVALLRERGRASFRELSEDAPDTLTVVARFLALLELYREKAVALDQEEALGELMVVWAGGGAEAVAVTDEFDQVVEEKQ